ncbi:MAG: hypothetical protein M3Y57_15125 [Acidobacteriota bacterium]|nr:hypothetical protein [Acidobacteriota bacterium]
MKTRHCAWVNVETPLDGRAVWGRDGVYSSQCPKSVITAATLNHLEQYAIWKQFGGDPERLGAKAADAIVLLEWAWKKETTNGEV